MANGQAVLTAAVLDTAEVDRLCAELETAEIRRHVMHAAQLHRALGLERTYADAGMALQTTAVLALVLRCSEQAAALYLHQARVLERLGALESMTTGLLTVEQGRVVVDVLGPVDVPEVADRVWARLRRRLEENMSVGAVLPPARTAELLRRWLIESDPGGAIDRRKQAEEAAADVDLWRRDDGLVDIAVRGVTGPNAQACGQRIRDHADPIGLGDERTAGQRLRDAAVDLILGRTTLAFPAAPHDSSGADISRCGRTGCGCAQARPVPCGAAVQVLVPLTSALGTADTPAELVGHGPIESDLLQALLLADPVLTRVWVDPVSGAPVADDDRAWTPGRGDPVALRQALLDIAANQPPGQVAPVHPDDHADLPPPAPDSAQDLVLDAAANGPPRVLGHAHRPGTPGPYIFPRRLRRLLTVRSPRCEWPGCGRRALSGSFASCDLDHDLAWPAGPTCACNAGPACRRHHRIKQLGWVKQRRAGGHVRWTSQTGRRWLSRGQHEPPPSSVRRLPALPEANPFAGLTDQALVEVLWHSDPTDPIFDTYDVDRCPNDNEPVDDVCFGERYVSGGLWARLDDPTAWEDVPDPADPDAAF